MFFVQHVTIDVDRNWETEFVPWLEDQERQNIGVEDGAFLATVAPSLRVLQSEGEGPFIKECLRSKLSSVSTLALKEFNQKGIYQFSAIDKEDGNEDFKKIMWDLHSYKTDTCCTSIFTQCEDIQNVFRHLDSDIFSEYAEVDEKCRSGK